MPSGWRGMIRTSYMELGVKNWKEIFCKLAVIRVCKDVIFCHKGPQNFPHLEIPFRWVGSQDSVVSILSEIGAGGTLVRIPSGETKYSLVLLLQAIPGFHPHSYSICTRSFQVLTQPERNFDYKCPRSAEVTMSESVYLLPA